MLDGNIFDEIVADKKLKAHIKKLRRKGDIENLTTYKVIQQLEQTANKEKREALLKCCKDLTVEKPANVFLLGDTPLNKGRLSNGVDFEKAKGNSKDLEDAIIGVTSVDEDCFVTNDNQLRKRVQKQFPKVKCLDFRGFVKEIGYEKRDE